MTIECRKIKVENPTITENKYHLNVINVEESNEPNSSLIGNVKLLSYDELSLDDKKIVDDFINLINK